MSDGGDDDRRRFGRRGFFRDGLRELMRPVAAAIETRLADIADALPAAPPSPRGGVSLKLLRPPGARDEPDFLAACSRCGDCVRVCPADAIKIEVGVAGGAPYIDADLAPCVVCTTLECMTVCPTGALVAVPMKFIDMGTARWQRDTCVRTTEGSDCTICVDECPIGEVAIRLVDGRVHVSDSGCVGCGVCQHRCPTVPKSIVVEPRAERTVG